MKKILSVLAIMLAVVVLGACKNTPPQKTPEQIRADSIQKIKTDSINRVKSFKKIALDGFDKFLKRQISKDPGYGKTLEAADLILSDSIYLARCRYAIKNVYGAVQQGENAYLLVCRDGKQAPCMLVGDKELMDRFLNNTVKDCAYLPLIADDSAKMRSKIINSLCVKGSGFFDMDRFIERGLNFSPF